MLSATQEITVKGKKVNVPAYIFDDVVIVTTGSLINTAKVFDEYWLPAESLPDPNRVIQYLLGSKVRPDIFTFAQRVPDTQPRFQYHMEWDNVAAIPVSSYENWLHNQISSSSRRNIRASEKKGIVVKAAPFDEKYVRGIMSIFNESSVRAGRRYWHYGKDYEVVEKENGTYRERSTFLSAFYKDEMVGYMKIVWDTQSAAIMQILSKMAFLEKRPNNALLSEAVRLCEKRAIKFLLYERFVYGSKGEDSLTRFKEANGFVRMNIPRYYIPLTRKGKVALLLGMHREPRDLVPQWLRRRLVDMRDKWYGG